MSFGQYVDNELTNAGITDLESKKRSDEVNERRRKRLYDILFGGATSGVGPVLINKVDVPGRTRLPQADDPEDPYGLWDKSDPASPPPGKFKDPRTLWNQLEGRG